MLNALCKEIGSENIVACDISETNVPLPCQFEQLDVVDYVRYAEIVKTHKIDYIIHLAAILSALGEKKPDLAMQVNVVGVQNCLNLAREHNCKVYMPSTIAVFGGNQF